MGCRCTRKILVTNNRSLNDKGQGAAALPDMSVVGVDPVLGQADSAHWRRVSSVSSFVKMTMQEGEDPESRRSSKNIIKTLIAPAADYAGLHFASRPFQMFIIGFVIFRRHFRAALFTHSNIYFSEKLDILTRPGLAVLIRVVRSVTWRLTNRDMGLSALLKV